MFLIPFRRSTHTSLLQALDASLERLGVERIDLYQIHFPPPTHEIDEYAEVLARAVNMGKVRAVGVSNFNASLINLPGRIAWPFASWKRCSATFSWTHLTEQEPIAA